MAQLPIQIRREVVAQWSLPKLTTIDTVLCNEKRREIREHRRSIAKVLGYAPGEVWDLEIEWRIYWREFFLAVTAYPPKMTPKQLSADRLNAVRKLKEAAQALENNDGYKDPCLLGVLCDALGTKMTSAEHERTSRQRRLQDWHEIMGRIPFDVRTFTAYSQPTLFGVEAFNAWKSPRYGGTPKSAKDLLFYLDIPLSDLLRAAAQAIDTEAPKKATGIRASNDQAVHAVRYEEIKSFFLQRAGKPHETLALAVVKAYATAEDLPDVDEDRLTGAAKQRKKRSRSAPVQKE